jgi:hypothetical protein
MKEDDKREEDAIVHEVERAYESIPPRTTIPISIAGVTYFLVNGRFLECTGCKMRVPQSRTRQSPSARDLWIRIHVSCART